MAIAYAFSYTGGALLQWCTDTLAKREKELAKEAGISVNEYLEGQYMEERASQREKAYQGESTSQGENTSQRERVSQESGPTGLLILPHFAGAATPYMDTGSRGAILGLTASTTTADLYRACMEGVVYEMYLNVKALQGSGVHFTRMHATGGGARSAEWMQMKADMLNMPITALKTADAGTVGSAMLTGIAIGVFADLEDAAGHMVEKTREYYPRRDMHEGYLQIFERYEKVYRAVRPLV